MVEKENGIAVVTIHNDGSKKSENNVATNKIENGGLLDKNESLKALAFQFFEAYYTKLSDHPDDIGAFYGDDSNLVLGDIVATGRENIQRAIGSMKFGDCKSRFYAVKAAPAIEESKVFQVCGELTLKGQAAPRRFCQTIVLSCVPPNVLYVKSNIFQWLEDAFPQSEREKYYFISPPTTVSLSQQPTEKQLEENGNDPVIANATLKKIVAEPPQQQQQPLLNGGNVVQNRNQLVQIQSQQLVSVAPHSPSQTPVASEIEQEPTCPTMSNMPPPGLEKKATPEIEQHTTLQLIESPQNQSALVIKDYVEEKHVKIEMSENNSYVLANNVQTEMNVVKESSASMPLHQSQKFKTKSESKSWNEVVSGGQNKQQPLQFNSFQSTGNRNQTAVTPLSNVQNATAKQSIHLQQPIASMVQKASPQQTVINQNQQSNVSEKHVSLKPMEKKFAPIENSDQQQIVHSTLAPRKDWPHRIYFSNLTKPGHFVDFKAGQQELMKEIRGITDGVEFVGIKPISLRKDYKSAFGFIDFTTPGDMEAVYNACQKDAVMDNKNGRHRLKVNIPTFEFEGYLSLGADKTNNLGFFGGINGGSGSGFGRTGGGYQH